MDGGRLAIYEQIAHCSFYHLCICSYGKYLPIQLSVSRSHSTAHSTFYGYIVTACMVVVGNNNVTEMYFLRSCVHFNLMTDCKAIMHFVVEL